MFKYYKPIEPRTEHLPACFDMTLEIISENFDAVVVHGWISGTTQWILHAWCEFGDDVVDLSESRDPIPRSEYYPAMGVEEERIRRYSRLDFFTLVTELRHFGPFDKELFFAVTSLDDPLAQLNLK